MLEDLGGDINRYITKDYLLKYPKLSTRTYTIKENGFITIGGIRLTENYNWYGFQGWIPMRSINENTPENNILVNSTPISKMFSFGDYHPVFKGDIITDYGVITSFRTEIATMQQNHIEKYTFGQYSPEVNFIPYLKKNK